MRLEFTLDCTDLDHTAEFWQAAVGFVVDGSIEGRYVSLSGNGVTLTLQWVAEPKTVKNRMHLDPVSGEPRAGGRSPREPWCVSRHTDCSPGVRSDVVRARGPRGQRVLRRPRAALTGADIGRWVHWTTRLTRRSTEWLLGDDHKRFRSGRLR